MGRWLIPLAIVLLYGCAATTPPSPNGSATPTETPGLTASPGISARASEPVGSSEPSPPAPPSPAGSPPTASPPTDTTAEEAYVLAGVRRELTGCSPRRVELPPGTVAAVECRPDSPLVDAVGFYLFGTQAEMLDVYLDRMAEAGVERDSGTDGCDLGEPGEGAWTPGDVEPVPDRVGCFLNDQGFANVRWTLSVGPMYIGVVGDNDDIASLIDWSYGAERFSTPRGTDLWGPPNGIDIDL